MTYEELEKAIIEIAGGDTWFIYRVNSSYSHAPEDGIHMHWSANIFHGDDIAFSSARRETPEEVLEEIMDQATRPDTPVEEQKEAVPAASDEDDILF